MIVTLLWDRGATCGDRGDCGMKMPSNSRQSCYMLVQCTAWTWARPELLQSWLQVAGCRLHTPTSDIRSLPRKRGGQGRTGGHLTPAG